MSRAIWKRERGLDRQLVEALEQTGLPWRIEIGKKHRKILLDERQVGVVPLKGTEGGDCLNIISAVKRLARERAGA